MCNDGRVHSFEFHYESNSFNIKSLAHFEDNNIIMIMNVARILKC